MKIGIDLDGTLSKSFEHFTKVLQDKGYDISYEEFVYNVGYPPKIDRETMWNHYYEHVSEMRRSYPVYEGAKAVIAFLAEHEFIAITKRNAEAGIPCPDTLHWIEKHAFPFSKVFFVGDKAKVCLEEGVDVLIDDYDANALEVAEAGVPVLLHEQHYNKSFSHPLVTRFSHWLEVPSLLKRLPKQ